MKPPPFSYHRPDTLAEALALLDEHGDDAKVLAGGQSLIPLMGLRMGRPGHVVDIGRAIVFATTQAVFDIAAHIEMREQPRLLKHVTDIPFVRRSPGP